MSRHFYSSNKKVIAAVSDLMQIGQKRIPNIAAYLLIVFLIIH